MNKYIYIILFLLSFTVSFAQDSNLTKKSESNKNISQDEPIFKEIESGIRETNVRTISKYFGQQTYFSFSSGINGYYSNNQAFYVLEDFFKLYKVISFKFDYIKTDKNNGHATGNYNYDNRGQRSTSQVYISIKKIGSNWIITQFTIN
ncbi:MAG TPA: DUF4783 domain-containing protein [Ignavibacteriaceae bacterium]|nr:DUF4783 domain-containing protein [Ignavibacteriaceae bacterium]